MSKCPYCFHPLDTQWTTFRCESGRCDSYPRELATSVRGYPVSTPNVIEVATGSDGIPATAARCDECGGHTKREVCGRCLYDIPPNWRDAQALTVTVVGARGSGKTVYIAVMLEVLKRYMERASRTLEPFNNRTENLYDARFYQPLFVENAVLDQTPVISQDASAPQRDPLIWKGTAGPNSWDNEFYLVVRDNAGEDFGRAREKEEGLAYIADSDLVIFMFDPMVLQNVRGVLQGIIPDIKSEQLGGRAEEVFPNLITHVEGQGGHLALVVGKFDSLQQLAEADNEYATVMSNPAAQFNRDETMRRPVGASDWKDNKAIEGTFDGEIDFLDAELRSLLAMLKTTSMTNQADQAYRDGRFRDFRHFAVSALGETPVHDRKLTERGISPFRVLDPILWGLSKHDIWI